MSIEIPFRFQSLSRIHPLSFLPLHSHDVSEDSRENTFTLPSAESFAFPPTASTFDALAFTITSGIPVLWTMVLM